jgi:nuclease-like protein/PhoH-like protein
MELIPSVVFNFPSRAEERVFEHLRAVSLGADWIAYHSLNLSEHEYKAWAEIDFLVLGPEAALVLEVKGGRIRREQGVWVHTDRFGREHRHSEGPFNQAKTAMYALRDRLANHHRVRVVREKDLAFGWGVLFPDIDWQIETPEHPAELVADRRDLGGVSSFTRYLSRLCAYWSQKARGAAGASTEDMRELKRVLRPDVDLYPPLTSHVGRVLSRMQALTEEQYERLSIIEANERVIVSGGAGTGKTFLALQMARRAIARGDTVALVVSSAVLAAWLRKLEPDRRLQIQAYGIDQPEDKPVDLLLVDEGQDLMDLKVLVRLSDRVRGGLEQGRWCWFMDENRQAGIRGTFDPEALAYLSDGMGRGGVMRVPLTQNVRNTIEVAEAAADWTGADVGQSSLAGHGREPQIVVLDGQAELGTKLSALLDELFDDGAEAEEIGLVYPLEFRTEWIADLDRRIKRKLIPLDVSTVRAGLSGRIVHGSVADFKGLERPIMICVGYDDPAILDDDLAQVYVAVTRANFGLYIVCDAPFAGSLIQRR